jgi:uncharacterized SAM-binding protein YcdF (DUF218 family)
VHDAGLLSLFVLLVVFLASIYAVPAGVCRVMNRGRQRFAGTDATSEPSALVVLSGRVNFRRDVAGGRRAVLSRSCDARVREAVRVYELIAPRWVISTGGIPTPTCAELMKSRLVEFGVPPNRVLLEDKSRTTRDEAVFVAEMLGTMGARQTVIVTSDVHMPRSLAAFRAVGIHALPAGAPDPGLERSWAERFLPSVDGLRFSRDVAHELLGIVVYRIRGWQG